MRVISAVLFHVLTVILSVVPNGAEARTRAPRTENEHSLLYWRYLCENQAQEETIAANRTIEFRCLSQNWKVIANSDSVQEVIEDAKK